MDPIHSLPLDIGLHGSKRLRQTLHEQLRQAIIDGRLKPGFQLPATRALAAQYGISRNTVMSAYDLLLSEGYLHARPGSGTYVANVRPPMPHVHSKVSVKAADRLNAFWEKAGTDSCPEIKHTLKYDFRLGIPEVAGFRADTWRRISSRILREQARLPADYADPQGSETLRAAIAKHVSFTRSVSCQPADIFITAGAQQAFDLLARILVTPGETRVAVEDPGYTSMHRAFSAAGARIVPAPVDKEGLVVSSLPRDTRVILVTPSHQFPLGITLSMQRRLDLLEFSRNTGAIIIEDDYDSEYRYGMRPLDALQTLDRDESVFYVGTFSKTLMPALRLGFAIVPQWAQPAFAAAKRYSDWHCPVAVQDTLATFIDEGHLARHVRKMRKVYGYRRDTLLDILRRDFSRWLHPLPPEAGLHLAAMTTRETDIENLVARAREKQVGVYSLLPYCHQRAKKAGLVLGFGAIDTAGIEAGLARLHDLFP